MAGLEDFGRLDQSELKEFGRRLRAARNYKRPTSADRAAKALGTSRSTLERWEGGIDTDDPPKRRGLAIGMAHLAGIDPNTWFGVDYSPGFSAAAGRELAVSVEELQESVEEISEVLAIELATEGDRELAVRIEQAGERLRERRLGGAGN